MNYNNTVLITAVIWAVIMVIMFVRDDSVCPAGEYLIFPVYISL